MSGAELTDLAAHDLAVDLLSGLSMRLLDQADAAGGHDEEAAQPLRALRLVEAMKRGLRPGSPQVDAILGALRSRS